MMMIIMMTMVGKRNMKLDKVGFVTTTMADNERSPRKRRALLVTGKLYSTRSRVHNLNWRSLWKP